MSGKQHRLRRRAAREQYHERFGNRAERAAKAPAERELAEKLANLVKERDLVLASANAAFEKGLAELRKSREETRARAWSDYDGAKEGVLADYHEQKEKAA